MGEFPNPFKDERKKSKGEKEVEAGGNLVKIFRLLGIRMPYQADVVAVERVGQLIVRRYPWLAKPLGVKP